MRSSHLALVNYASPMSKLISSKLDLKVVGIKIMAIIRYFKDIHLIPSALLL